MISFKQLYTILNEGKGYKCSITIEQLYEKIES